MKVIIPRHSGFCPGVKRAERRLFKEKRRRGDSPLAVLGALIHNRGYIRYLEQRGIGAVDDLDGTSEQTVIAIRTHGIDRRVEETLRSRFEVIDLTCPKVKKLQLQIKEHSEAGYFVLITGKKSHPEVQGHVSYARDFSVVENLEDLEAFLENRGGVRDVMESKGYERIYVVSQTTAPRSLFEETVKAVTNGLAYEVSSCDTICACTSLKESEALKVQEGVDATFIVGDRISSNANRLYEALKARDDHSYFIQNLEELKGLGLDLSLFKVAQVVSSSSTPDFIEREIVEYLGSL
jgi:4-hydroxy-3-methylbut-2-enyl diphosphate reductase